MKGVQCYELFGGIALKNHAFSFFHFIFNDKASSYNFSVNTYNNNCVIIPLISFIFVLLKKHNSIFPIPNTNIPTFTVTLLFNVNIHFFKFE